MKLFLKGTKCFSDKCPIEKRNFAPGQHGKDRKAKIVGYGLQLREKQKAKRIYFTQEGQFRNYFEKAATPRASPANCCCSSWSGVWTTSCSVSASAVSRRQARQFVRHGHIAVNGRKVNIPSFQVSVGDEIAIRENSRKLRHPGSGEGISPATRLRRTGWRSTATTTRAASWLCPSAKTSICRSTSS